MASYVIPKEEYFDRIKKFQARIKAAGLDACLVHGTESDFANVRYLTGADNANTIKIGTLSGDAASTIGEYTPAV